jgi:organic hydroperoxide reductase OsmC/OhrA
MPLEMRPECERCHAALAADTDAFICSFECTFCPTCTGQLASVCPNCSGELSVRPRRGHKLERPADNATKHKAQLSWQRNGTNFTDGRYSRVHTWQFDGGLSIPASPSPHVVKAPYSDANAVDPEEAFVIALASCHMLWFLDLAAQAGVCVDRYEDEPYGVMLRTPGKRLALGYIVLQPNVVTSSTVTEQTLHALHERAHETCFLANALRYPVQIAARHQHTTP